MNANIYNNDDSTFFVDGANYNNSVGSGSLGPI